MRLHPDAMVRFDDYEVFTINEDNTYSSNEQKRKYPNSSHNKFDLQTLELKGFSPLFTAASVCEREYIKYFQERRLSCLEEIMKYDN